MSRRRSRTLSAFLLGGVFVATAAVSLPSPVAAADEAADATPKQYTASMPMECQMGVNDEGTWLTETVTLGVIVTLPTSVSPGQTIPVFAGGDHASGEATYSFDITEPMRRVQKLGGSLPQGLSVWLEGVKLEASSGSGASSSFDLPEVRDGSNERLQSEVVDVISLYDDPSAAAVAQSVAPFPTNIIVPDDAEGTIRLDLTSVARYQISEHTVAGDGWKELPGARPWACDIDEQSATEHGTSIEVPVVGQELGSWEEVPDKEVSGTFNYICQINPATLGRIRLPVHVTATAPERVAPGSRFQVPAQMTFDVPGSVGRLAKTFGDYTYFVAYSDNVKVNVINGDTKTVVGFPRISAATLFPDDANNSFELKALPVTGLINVPEDAEGQLSFGMPDANQITHPNPLIGGRTAFSIAIQLFKSQSDMEAGATPLLATMACTPSPGAELVLGTIDIDPTLQRRVDEQPAEGPTLPIYVPKTAPASTGTKINATNTLAAGVTKSSGVLTGKTFGAAATTQAKTAPGAQASEVPVTVTDEKGAEKVISFGTDASATEPHGGSAGLDLGLLLGGAGVVLGVLGVIRHHRRSLYKLLH